MPLEAPEQISEAIPAEILEETLGVVPDITSNENPKEAY